MPRIRPLDKSVVNRIAAGEIIIAPSNALKEMLENSIDAKSTAIDVSVKDGGLKLLQITDNGSGIDKLDLPLLCERFATSKLTKFEDLESINTYGFRGEALASISHISHLSVVTKRREDDCAWKCYFLDGKLVPPPTGGSSEPRAIAGRDGTSIVVEDLFYNVPSRLRALRSKSEEYAQILDVASKYAIHTDGVAFTCKKQGTNANDLVIRASLPAKERIRAVYGSGVANELVEVNAEPDLDIGLIKCTGWVTGANYDNKKSQRPVLFINNRLVVCDPIRRAVNQLYAAYLPKGHKPFVYLSLEIDPKNVDVNVHPTKREVRFLNEEAIVAKVVDAIEVELSKQDSSRNFLTQRVIPQSQKRTIVEPEVARPAKMRSMSSIKQFKKPYEKDMVRTDFNQSKLTSFVKNDTLHSEQQPQPQVINLTSIKNLRKKVQTQTSAELTAILGKHTYIGVADYERRLACIQHDVNLYLLDYASLCNEFFYQVGLSDFGNFGKIRFTEPIEIGKLVKNEIYDTEIINYYPNAPSADDVVQILNENSDMMDDYFSMEIDDGKLKTIPMLVRNYLPSFNKLSLFLFKLATKVNWKDEEDCLGGILKQLALFYVPEVVTDDEGKAETAKALEDTIFPLIKKRFLATTDLKRDLVEIANLPGLYKVFERC